VSDLVAKISPRADAALSGALDKGKLSLAARAIVAAARSPGGDYRDWDEIHAWVDGIAQDLQ
jgi:menaquinone-dependent protoporphyrinogen oxidase